MRARRRSRVHQQRGATIGGVFRVALLGALSLKCGDGEEPLGIPTPSMPEGDASVVFAENKLFTYELGLPHDAWEALKRNAREEDFTEAELRVGDEQLGTVGLRFKGGVGTLGLCFDAAGKQTCPKLSMKIDFSRYDSRRRFRGLKRLNFHSMIADESHLHDRLGYQLFREMGIAAPRTVHARLVVNREYLGLFALVEQIDGRFTDDRFEPGDGNLYKEQWPDTDDEATLTGHLETNRHSPDHAELRAFHRELSQASDAELAATLERWMDPQQLLSYMAVDRTIANWDGITAAYCKEDGCHNHNYYLYQNQGNPPFTLIPWDLDNTFEPANAFSGVPEWNATEVSCAQHLPVFDDSRGVPPPSCDPVLRALALRNPEEYRAALTRLADGPFNLGKMNRDLDRWSGQLAREIALDTHGPSLDRWQEAVGQLRQNLVALSERLELWKQGETTAPFSLNLDGVNDLEAQTAASVRFGMRIQAATASDLTPFLNSTLPLSGGQDLGLRFEFRDGTGPWSQWMTAYLPFSAGQAVDLRAKSRLRIKLRADAPRSVSLGLESNRSELTAKFGWELKVDSTAQTYELDLRSARYPEWGPVVAEPLDDVLGSTTALIVCPSSNGRDANGFLGKGRVDTGLLQIDDVEFISE